MHVAEVVVDAAFVPRALSRARPPGIQPRIASGRVGGGCPSYSDLTTTKPRKRLTDFPRRPPRISASRARWVQKRIAVRTMPPAQRVRSGAGLRPTNAVQRARAPQAVRLDAGELGPDRGREKTQCFRADAPAPRTALQHAHSASAALVDIARADSAAQPSDLPLSDRRCPFEIELIRLKDMRSRPLRGVANTAC